MKVKSRKKRIFSIHLNQSLRNSISIILLIFMDIRFLSLMWLSLMVSAAIVTLNTETGKEIL